VKYALIALALPLTLPLALVAAAQPLPQLAAPELALIESGAKDIGVVVNQDVPVTLDDKTAVAFFDGERMHVSPAMVATIKTRQEARALAAMALAYGHGRLGARTRGKTSAAEYVIALPLYMLAQGARDSSRGPGLSFDNDTNDSSPQEIRAESRKIAGQRAALAIHLTEQAGGCTGPMVDLLNRMRGHDSTSAVAGAASQAGFARMVLRDMGNLAYPPDNRCAG
jgi:hypothetical protein